MSVRFLFTFLFSCCTLVAFAQSPPKPVVLSRQSTAKLLAEDEARGGIRYSAPLAVDIKANPTDFANYDGVYYWEQTIQVSNAPGVGVFLDQVAIPAGAMIGVKSNDRVVTFQPEDVSSEQRLFSGVLGGAEVTVFYQGSRPAQAPFRIWRVDYVFRPEVWKEEFTKDFGDSNACQVNAGCGSGDGWEDEQAGTARIHVIVAEGIGWCSGNLLNNTAQDGRPFLLTGFHCMDGFTPLYDLWRVDFDYAGVGCDNPDVEPTPITYTGVAQRAGRRETDFLLLEILDVDFAAEDHYFAGWERDTTGAVGDVLHFHHPRGDIRKIGHSDRRGARVVGTPIQWNNDVTTPARHHYRVNYAVGSFQTGSSGSAFFDPDHRVVGQLNGGNASCEDGTEAFVGRFDLSFSGAGAGPAGNDAGSRLREWLDPLGLDPINMDGAWLRTRRYLSGVVRLGDRPVAGVSVQLSWTADSTTTVVTDVAGQFRTERPALTESFAVKATYGAERSLVEAVDVGDVITLRRHILGLQTLDAPRQVASDVNSSGSLTVTDITQMTRVILGVGDWAGRPNWLVLPTAYPLEPLPRNPAAPIGLSITNPGLHELTLDWLVLKSGDANGSASE